MDMDYIVTNLCANGADVKRVLGECPDEASFSGYLLELEQFLKSYDFMRLGQAVNHGQWNGAQMKSSAMNRTAMKLGLMSWSRQLQGIRQAAAVKNREEANQLLSLIISRRVKLMELLKNIRDEHPELFARAESSDV